MNVFIGCSSKEKLNEIYINSATNLAEYLSKKSYNLVCGGIDGTMKIIGEVFTKNNMNTTIMTVEKYQNINSNNHNIYSYNTIGERKYSLINNSNLIIFLPGGLGTLDEIFTTIESKRANEHNLPIIILNINNYYEGIIKQLDKLYEDNFANKQDRNLYHITNNIEETIKYIEQLGDNNEHKKC